MDTYYYQVFVDEYPYIHVIVKSPLGYTLNKIYYQTPLKCWRSVDIIQKYYPNIDTLYNHWPYNRQAVIRTPITIEEAFVIML